MAVSLYGQANFQPGYLIDLKGDTIYGEVDSRGDLFMGKMKSPERGMEVWTSAAYIRLDDLWIGVKSLSNLAMAGTQGCTVVGLTFEHMLLMEALFQTIQSNTKVSC